MIVISGLKLVEKINLLFRKRKILSFSGLDGAGKSTQIDMLTNRLVDNKAKVKYLWARAGYTPGFNFLKKCIRLLRPTSIPKSGHSDARTKAFGNPRTRKIWLTLALLDMYLFYGIYLRIASWKYDYIICDRYLEDSLIDFHLNFPEEKVENWTLWKSLLSFAPKPDTSFLFFIPVKESLRRSILKGEPFPDKEEVLEDRLALYHAISKGKNWKIMDGLLPKEAIHDAVFKTINS